LLTTLLPLLSQSPKLLAVDVVAVAVVVAAVVVGTSSFAFVNFWFSFRYPSIALQLANELWVAGAWAK
jgi:hypothetical protein